MLIYAILLEICGNYGAVYFALLKTVPMFASETVNGITSDITGFFS